MGVVTAATSLIDALVKKNPEEYKGCVALAVSRLSRVSILKALVRAAQRAHSFCLSASAAPKFKNERKRTQNMLFASAD